MRLLANLGTPVFTLICLIGGAAVCAIGGTAAGNDVQQSQALALFESKIRPVLVARCYECHSLDADEVQGGLLLDTRAAIRAGGDSGPAVVPGKPAESLLLSALRHEDFEMPPDARLADEVIADFVRWIELGAADPRDGEASQAREVIDYAAARQGWAYKMPQRHEPPAVKWDSWPADDIDRFLLARQEAAGIRPAPDADRAVLLRRVYYDLVGLPPTPEEVRAFLADDSPAALAQAVDRLLATEQYAERWARHWLDVARFAESAGGGRTQIYDSAWRYRDYVIEAFASDMPYSQFVREQIAGDLLPHENESQRYRQLVATGFLSLGPKNLDDQDKEKLRMDIVDEQLDTIGRVFLGMTIGCARCHDHKFDPISHADYYAMAGILRNVKMTTPGAVSGLVYRDLPAEGKLAEQLAAHEQMKTELVAEQKSLEVTRKSIEDQLASLTGGAAAGRIVVDDIGAELIGDWQSSTHSAGYLGARYLHDRNEAKGEKSATFRVKLPQAGRYEVHVSYTAGSNRAQSVPMTVHHEKGETTIKVDQTQTPDIGGMFVSLGVFEFSPATAAAIVVSNEQTNAYTIADAVAFQPIADQEVKNSKAWQEDLQSQRKALHQRQQQNSAELKKLAHELKSLESSAPQRPTMISVVEEAKIEDCRINIRGNIHNLGEQVPRGMLGVVPLPDDKADRWKMPDDESGRRQLADWIVSEHNPLAYRVYVNRVWQHLMGQGVVASSDNFGATGEDPTHPELLDTLSVEFAENGQSTKQLIRRIVLSRAYGLSTAGDKQAELLDPRNQLRWRGERRRLDAEAIRDTMLVLAGNLDATVGGPTIRPNTSNEFGYQFEEGRRSIYVPVFRNNLHEMLAIFDFADPNLVVSRRNASNLPTQALFLMNSPFVLEQSASFAKRLLAEDHDNDAVRLDRAYLLALVRPPTDAERDAMLAFLDKQITNPEDVGQRQQAWSRICQTLFASVDFRYLK